MCSIHTHTHTHTQHTYAHTHSPRMSLLSALPASLGSAEVLRIANDRDALQSAIRAQSALAGTTV